VTSLPVLHFPLGKTETGKCRTEKADLVLIRYQRMEVAKMIPGQITLRATMLVLACSVGAALVSESTAHPQNPLVEQDPPKIGAL